MYPGFQFDSEGIRTVIAELVAIASEHGWDETSLISWLTAPTTYLNGQRPFDAVVEHLDPGTRLHRVHSNTRTVTEFNPVGLLPYAHYAEKVLGLIEVTRPVRLANLRGLGLRRLKDEARQVTDTDASEYSRTVLWAQAAHATGFDGLAWTSRQCNDTRGVVLFGDRCHGAVTQDPSFARIFQSGPGLDWLIATCAPLHVEVLPPSGLNG